MGSKGRVGKGRKTRKSIKCDKSKEGVDLEEQEGYTRLRGSVKTEENENHSRATVEYPSSYVSE